MDACGAMPYRERTEANPTPMNKIVFTLALQVAAPGQAEADTGSTIT
jgi:hypothetical protein